MMVFVGMLEKAFFVAEYDAVYKTGASGQCCLCHFFHCCYFS